MPLTLGAATCSRLHGDMNRSASTTPTFLFTEPDSWATFNDGSTVKFREVRPADADAVTGERSITPDDTEIGYYEKSGLLLEDVLREQVLLSLPDRALCKPDCKGLCPRCGQNLNQEACSCDAAPVDTRWSALADLADRIKK